MISRLTGHLVSMDDGSALVQCGEHLTYELLVPGADQQRLATMVGERVVFHTLHYLESANQGASYVPRLIGFPSPADRDFFELFTTVKGIGNRKALRALQIPFADVASAISHKDADLLKSLPEIGKRTAETIIVELHGKVDRFIEVKLVAGVSGRGGSADPRQALVNDAVAVLVQLGEMKMIARQLVDRALAADPELTTADAVVAAAFRLRELV